MFNLNDSILHYQSYGLFSLLIFQDRLFFPVVLNNFWVSLLCSCQGLTFSFWKPISIQEFYHWIFNQSWGISCLDNLSHLDIFPHCIIVRIRSFPTLCLSGQSHFCTVNLSVFMAFTTGRVYLSLALLTAYLSKSVTLMTARPFLTA